MTLLNWRVAYAISWYNGRQLDGLSSVSFVGPVSASLPYRSSLTAYRVRSS